MEPCVYILHDGQGHYKIGKTTDLENRMKALAIQLPFKCEQVGLFGPMTVERMHKAERELHVHFASKRLNGEWFALDQDDLNWIYVYWARNPVTPSVLELEGVIRL